MLSGILAAVNIQEVFAIIVLVISVLSWLVNLIQGNSANGAAPRQQQKPRPQSSRNELEDLIQELTSDRRKLEKRNEAPKPPKPQPPKARGERPERPRPAPTTVPQRPGSPPPYTPSRQPQPIPEPKRPVANHLVSDFGEGVRSHQVASRNVAPPQPAPLSSAKKSIESRSSFAPVIQEKPIHPLVKLLREPGGMRQALLLNEILQRPKSLRH